MPLPRAFFERDAAVVARAMLGTRLVSLHEGVRVGGTIVECEAYRPGDSASHAFRGRTRRNASMFAHGGVAYVYFTYGMHYCMNVSTDSEGIGSAVLVRALIPEEGVAVMAQRRGPRVRDRDLCRGPARLCVALGIDKARDGVDTCARGASVFFEAGEQVPARKVARGPRVGVSGSERDVGAALRFSVRDSEWVSR